MITPASMNEFKNEVNRYKANAMKAFEHDVLEFLETEKKTHHEWITQRENNIISTVAAQKKDYDNYLEAGKNAYKKSLTKLTEQHMETIKTKILHNNKFQSNINNLHPSQTINNNNNIKYNNNTPNKYNHSNYNNSPNKYNNTNYNNNSNNEHHHYFHDRRYLKFLYNNQDYILDDLNYLKTSPVLPTCLTEADALTIYHHIQQNGL